jgi:hypothetical protein
MTATTISPADIEGHIFGLSADSKAHIGSILLARAAEERVKLAEGGKTTPDNADPETEAAFAAMEPLADRLIRHAGWSRSVGIDDDLIGANIARELLDLGHTQEESAKLIADAGIDWRFRTADEHLVAAAAELLAMAMEPATVRAAFAGLEVA